MEIDFIEDLSTLSNVKRAYLDKFKSIAEYAICEYIDTLREVDQDFLSLDIGIGKINILKLEDEVQYEFKPSSRLEKKILSTIEDETNPLTQVIETKLEDKIINTYKDLI